jgi:hypothetical protein
VKKSISADFFSTPKPTARMRSRTHPKQQKGHRSSAPPLWTLARLLLINCQVVLQGDSAEEKRHGSQKEVAQEAEEIEEARIHETAHRGQIRRDQPVGVLARTAQPGLASVHVALSAAADHLETRPGQGQALARRTPC